MTVRITMDTSGLVAVAARLQNASALLTPVLKQGTQQLADESMRLIEEATPIGIGRTGGHLAESYSTTVYDSFPQSGGFTLSTSQGSKLRYVRFGTGIYGAFGHPIIPVTKHALWWPGVDRPRRSVRGQQPNDFVLRVIAQIMPYATEEMQHVLHQMAASLAEK